MEKHIRDLIFAKCEGCVASFGANDGIFCNYQPNTGILNLDNNTSYFLWSFYSSNPRSLCLLFKFITGSNKLLEVNFKEQFDV